MATLPTVRSDDRSLRSRSLVSARVVVALPV
jgi:hypothetical protein